MKDFNAYREVPIYDGRGVWRDGNTLVMERTAFLPFRCVWCNEPARSRLRRTLWWYPPALLLLLAFCFLPGFVLFLFIVVLIQQEATIQLPLCREHRDRRLKGLMIAWLNIHAGILLCFAPILSSRLAFLIAIGALMIVFGSIYAVIQSRVVVARKIDGTHLWIKNVCPAYLDTLPELDDLARSIAKPKPVPFDDEL